MHIKALTHFSENRYKSLINEVTDDNSAAEEAEEVDEDRDVACSCS